ncbi:MAG: efflux RND transporter periplasmic adaptor subunit [Alphaproteobacteria bacterium]|nr:efflux RND transporter periplasmic adaptor subunit [Alphaproteobacteria bacterium]
MGALAVGQKIIAELDAFSGKTFEGEVYAIDPLIDVAGRSIAVRANLPNPGRALRPGLFARVTLVVEERARAVVVPEQAIVPQGGNFFVFKVADGKAALVPVEIGRRAAGRVEIVKGVHPGESVVVAGQIKIRDGVPVRPIAPSPAPSAPKPGN